MPDFSSRVPRGVRRLFRLPLTQARMLRDADDELQFHFAMRVTELRDAGMSETDARAEAVRRFGDTEEFREYTTRRASHKARWQKMTEWLSGWMQDIRFAARQFRKNPGFTAIAVLTLALGIGANTAIFTVVHRLLLAPLPYPDGNRIVMLTNRGTPDAATLRLWRARAHSIESIATIDVDAIAVLSGEEQDTVAAYITANYLQLLSVRPALGRGFTADEERPGAPAVAMIGYGHWQREYGGRVEAIGQTVHVGDHPYTIIGVTPAGLALPMEPPSFRGKLREAVPGIWLPVSLDGMADNADPAAYAKLRPGVSAQEASKELEAISNSVPGADQGRLHPRAMRAQDFLDPRETRTVQVLFVAVGVLLLIACANVANLLMSRALTRRREFAVRVALGAGRGRLARQVFTESLLLALGGGLLGIVVAWQTLRIIIALRPPSLEHLGSVHLESTVLLWSAGVSVVTGMLFGCAPALFAGARFVGDVLRSETRAGTGGAVSHKFRSTLIVLEIALSLVLLVGAGLLVRSFVALQHMPLGFEPHGLIQVDALFAFPRQSGDVRAAREARTAVLRHDIIEHLKAVPGVTEAALGTLPGDAYGGGDRLETEPDNGGQTRSVPAFSATFVSANYFRVARMSLVEGRLPDSTTSLAARAPGEAGPPEEIVVNRWLARHFWPNGNAVGSRLHAGTGLRRPVEPFIVVGVVDDVHMPGVRSAIKLAEIYQLPRRVAWTFLVRTATATPAIAAALRVAMTNVDPVVIFRGTTIGDVYLDDSLAPTRFAMALLAAFSIIALLLSAVGLYGVIAYSVTQRTREIGVRVALGADRRAVTSLVVGGGLRLAVIGAVLGVAAAAMSTRVLASLLYAVTPADPLTFAIIALVVVAIALLASYVPARRALRIDPITALRAD